MRAEIIVSTVRQAIEDASKQGIASAELAQQYAELCSQANKRLASCRNCFKQGMVSEALRIADTEPQLLDLCAALDFVGVEKWSKLCQDRKWTAAERLDAKAIQDINDAFSSGQITEPMMKEYRRAVRAGDTRECVRLLRRLAAVDKNNAGWLEDLKGFEIKRWGEIGKEYEQARKVENIDALASLLIEINGEWTTPRDDRLRNEVRAASLALYEKQAFQKGKEIVQTISKAYAALNYEQLEGGLNTFERLLAEGYLKPDAPMQAQVDEAKDWFRIEKKRREEERLYDETLLRLRSAVENGNPEELEDILNVLSRYERAIPDRLEERAKSILEGYQLARERARKRVWVTVIIVALMILTGIAGYLAKIRYDKQVAIASLELKQHYTAEDIAAFSAATARIEKEHPKVFQSEEVQRWTRRRNELSTLVEGKRAAYESVMVKLDAIRESGYAQDADNVEGLLVEARANITTGVDQGRMAIFVQDWEARKLALQDEADSKAQESIDALTREMDRLEKDSNRERASITRDLERIKTDFNNAIVAHDRARDTVKAQFPILSARMDGFERGLEGKDTQLAAIRKAQSLPEYLEAIETYARAFPEDQLTVTLGPIRECADSYRQFYEIPMNCGRSNIFWGADVEASEKRATSSREQWPSIKEQLLALEFEKRYTDLWECETAAGTIYFEGKPQKGNWQQGQITRLYEGMVYKPSEADLQPEFKVASGTESDVEPMPHCDYVRSLVSLGRFSTSEKALDGLLGKMKELYKYDGISPLLKLRLMDMLAGYVENLVGANGIPSWSNMRADLQSIDPSLHWLCGLHRDVKIANDRSVQILKKWFSPPWIINQYRFGLDAQEISLSRGMKWIGAADVIDPMQIKWVTNNKPSEVWVVRRVDGQPKTLLAAEKSQNGGKPYFKFFQGEPLFAPSDKTTTRDHMRDLKTKYSGTDTQNVDWPVSWPGNFRK